jgi:membrane fusion protein, heavy metal efflux system
MTSRSPIRALFTILILLALSACGQSDSELDDHAAVPVVAETAACEDENCTSCTATPAAAPAAGCGDENCTDCATAPAAAAPLTACEIACAEDAAATTAAAPLTACEIACAEDAATTTAAAPLTACEIACAEDAAATTAAAPLTACEIACEEDVVVSTSRNNDRGNSGGDLDLSPEELFAAHCEHGIPAHQCEGCRYEVGVVRVRPELLDAGLVATAEVCYGELPGGVSFTGEIRFDDRRIAHLGPRVPGTVLEALVDLGDRVQTGQALVLMESPELAGVQADYLEARAGHALSKRAFERMNELRSAGIASEREYLEVEQGRAAAEIRVNSSRQRLLQFGLENGEVTALEAGGIAEATGRFALRAPFDGEILKLHAVRGERLGPEDELALLGDLGSLWVWADLYENQIAGVSAAMAGGPLPVNISVNAFPGRRFPGRLEFLGRVMDERTRTVKSRIAVSNAEGLLRPGMFARIRMPVGETSVRLVVPGAALLADDGREFVFVRHDEDFFLRRPVTSGVRYGDQVEIVDGLSAGDSVVGTGAFLLKSDVLRSKMGAGCAH